MSQLVNKIHIYNFTKTTITVSYESLTNGKLSYDIAKDVNKESAFNEGGVVDVFKPKINTNLEFKV